MAVLLSINPTNLTPVNGRAVSPITLGGGRQISNGTKSVRLLAYPNGRSIMGLDSAYNLDFWTSSTSVPFPAIGAFVLAIALPSSLKAPGVPGDLGWNAFHVRAGSGTLSQNVYSDSGTSATGKAMFAAGGWQYTGSPAIIDGSWHVYIATWNAATGSAIYADGVQVASHSNAYTYAASYYLTFRLTTLKTRLDGVAQSVDPAWLGMFEMHDSAIADPATYSTDLLATFADMPIPQVHYLFPFDISWTAPQSGGSPITEYIVNVLQTVNGAPVILKYSLAPDVRTFHVAVPVAGVNTAIQVLAINALGSSTPTEVTI